VIDRPPRLAGAPITWGVCEVPGWGTQLAPERVLAEVAGLGLNAVELGPQGFLPGDPAQAMRTLAAHGLRLAAGFVPVVLHDAGRRPEALATAASAAGTLAAVGAEVLVLAAELGDGGYERSRDLTAGEWETLGRGLAEVRAIADAFGLRLAVHPHYGTAIEDARQVERLLCISDVPLCLDTGHLLVGGADPVAVARTAAGRVAHVHLKDVDAAIASQVRAGRIGYRDAVRRGLYRPLGEGDVDVAAIVGLLAAGGYDGWYVLEQDVVLDGEPAAGQGPVTDAARSVEYLRRVMRP
jgi:inosose dehydratase